MPRIADDDAGGFGLRCPGLYGVLMARRCLVDATTGTEADPRRRLVAECDEWAVAVQAAQTRADSLFDDRLGSGEPIDAAFWEVVNGRHGLRRELVLDGWDSSGQEFLVYPDDTIVMVPMI